MKPGRPKSRIKAKWVTWEDNGCRKFFQLDNSGNLVLTSNKQIEAHHSIETTAFAEVENKPNYDESDVYDDPIDYQDVIDYDDSYQNLYENDETDLLIENSDTSSVTVLRPKISEIDLSDASKILYAKAENAKVSSAFSNNNNENNNSSNNADQLSDPKITESHQFNFVDFFDNMNFFNADQVDLHEEENFEFDATGDGFFF
ncbi:hypothetical protein TRFO_35022 [Tritrichomonas foetus]|uniref:Uncharacterized protein n=1 Tax=Tritrichomonas foetus TaxID=1144522 RepID=A0A1J4JM32_9EUKA|nr:hypothetical protein TRFO_35022 [Tritrichomonas foetus]|eukprot:OHS98589.1 hypothetical protein TRFO_35022 [Tritrichomonas foetus]